MCSENKCKALVDSFPSKFKAQMEKEKDWQERVKHVICIWKHEVHRTNLQVE